MKNKLFSFVALPLIFSTTLAVFPFSCGSVRDKGIFKSFDRGENWSQKTVISKNESIASVNVLNLTLDPQNPQIIYLGTRSEGIYKSTDSGETWQHLDDAVGALSQRANVYDIAIDPRNNNNVYAGTYQDKLGRLFRSGDAGKSWQEVYRVSRQQYAIFAVEVDSYDPSVVYMGTAEGGLLKSVDHGKNWRIINWFDDVITDIKVNPHDTRTVYVSTYSDGLYKTTDKGESWQKIKSLESFNEADEMQVLVMDKNSPNVLYAGSKTGLFKTIDGGQSWQKLDIVIPEGAVKISSIGLDPVTSAYLYYGAGNVIYRTSDNGQTWSVHPLASGVTIKALAIDPQNPNVVYAGMHDKE